MERCINLLVGRIHTGLVLQIIMLRWVIYVSSRHELLLRMLIINFYTQNYGKRIQLNILTKTDNTNRVKPFYNVFFSFTFFLYSTQLQFYFFPWLHLQVFIGKLQTSTTWDYFYLPQENMTKSQERTPTSGIRNKVFQIYLFFKLIFFSFINKAFRGESKLFSLNSSPFDKQQLRAMKQIWLQKYRPKKLSEVYGNVEALNTLRSCVQQGYIPHLILSGPPGTGKTSSVLCIVNQLLGQQNKNAVKELNASDERGIDVVRDQIKTFAQKQLNLPKDMTKIIILDEADSLTEGAQQALRMIMSNFSETTRFVLSCNISSKLIEPIQSRCIILRFNKLKDDEVEKNLERIMKAEKVKISDKALRALLFISDGDMRQAINNLQACHYASQGNQIREELVLHVCDAPSIDTIKQIITLSYKGDIDQSLRMMHTLVEQGHSIYDLATNFSKILSYMSEKQIQKEAIYEMMKLVSELRAKILEGLATQLQLAQFLCKCSKIRLI